MSDRMKYQLLLLFGIAANTLPRWQSFGTVAGRKVYYVAQALSFVLIILADKFKPKFLSKWDRAIFDLTFGLALNNLLDEMFFDPVKFGVNEIIFSIAIIIWLIYRLRKTE